MSTYRCSRVKQSSTFCFFTFFSQSQSCLSGCEGRENPTIAWALINWGGNCKTLLIGYGPTRCGDKTAAWPFIAMTTMAFLWIVSCLAFVSAAYGESARFSFLSKFEFDSSFLHFYYFVKVKCVTAAWIRRSVKLIFLIKSWLLVSNN